MNETNKIDLVALGEEFEARLHNLRAPFARSSIDDLESAQQQIEFIRNFNNEVLAPVLKERFNIDAELSLEIARELVYASAKKRLLKKKKTSNHP